MTFLLRDCEVARVGGQLIDDLAPVRRSAVSTWCPVPGVARVFLSSYGSHPLQRHEAADIVHEVLQSDLHSRSDDADRPYEPTAG